MEDIITGYVGHFDRVMFGPVTLLSVVSVFFMGATILEFADEMRTDNSPWHRSQFF